MGSSFTVGTDSSFRPIRFRSHLPSRLLTWLVTFEGQEVGLRVSFRYPSAWSRWDPSQGRGSPVICQLGDLEAVVLSFGISELGVAIGPRNVTSASV